MILTINLNKIGHFFTANLQLLDYRLMSQSARKINPAYMYT